VRRLRYSINITLDGCCDPRAIPADEALHRHAAAVQKLKNEAGTGLLVGGVNLPQGAGGPRIACGTGSDEYEFVVHPRVAGGPWARAFCGAIETSRLEACKPPGVRLRRSGDAVRADAV